MVHNHLIHNYKSCLNISKNINYCPFNQKLSGFTRKYLMPIERKKQFIKIQNTLIRISKIDSVKTRYTVKANNFGKVSDESYPEIIISVGSDKYVFVFESEAEQARIFAEIEQVITG
jgi:hypothetical protein